MGNIVQSLIFLAFSLQLSSAATHSLQYFLTGVTPGISFPEFTIVGQLDDEQIAYYDSNSRRVIVKADWIKKGDDEEHWEMIMQHAVDRQELVRVRLNNIMKLFNQTKGPRTVQEMYRCELDDDRTKRGYRLYGHDGEDFLSLDLNTETWTAAVSQAVPTKLRWEGTAGLVRDQIHFLLSDCIDWLEKYVGYGRSILERKDFTPVPVSSTSVSTQDSESTSSSISST